MNFDVRITAQAKADITRNALWWSENHSVSQALVWIDALEKQIASLDTMPERFALAPEHGRFSYDIRQMLVGLNRPTYRLIYTIQTNAVIVLTVRAAEEDLLDNSDLPTSVNNIDG